MNVKKIFEDIGFNWTTDLVPKPISIINDESLNLRLKNKTFFYSNNKHTRTSFYLLEVDNLSEENIQNIHSRIWNENEADLFIYPDKEKIKINYVATIPNKELTILEIPVTKVDNELLDKISKYHFESGAFWLMYYEKLKDVKRQTVDQKLIETLSILRKKLQIEYTMLSNISQRDYLIQSLIDRTLFIKFLEDKHIINSYFYNNLFGSSKINYKRLLFEKNKKSINKLFKEINKLFNNHLFEEPIIHEDKLTKNVLTLLYEAISDSNLSNGQLSLFDFQFDVIPVEFISHIYQIFLEKEKIKRGIHYTPEGLVNLIVEDVIGDSLGTVLDPSCGSGIFLVLALRKMLENSGINQEANTYRLIKKRNKFLEENIFGIEIEPIAHRITYFSLYLELLYKIPPESLKKLIKDKIGNENFKLFPYSFKNNIICGNTLEVAKNKQPLKEKTFDFIVGNPPWKRIENDSVEEEYWKKHKEIFTSEKQLSQCFLHKINEWRSDNTRYGFVINSSNFESADKTFQKYFLSTYDIDNFYNLSKLDVFWGANEPCSIIIFNADRKNNNIINFLLPEQNDFTKKFDIVLLKPSDVIHINQDALSNEVESLRDYLLGNKKDNLLVEKIYNSNDHVSLTNYLCKTKLESGKESFAPRGLELSEPNKVREMFEISEKDWKSYNKAEKKKWQTKFKENNSRDSISLKEGYIHPYITPKDIHAFRLNSIDCYLKDTSSFRRSKNEKLYEKGNKILASRTGENIKAVLIFDKIYFSSDFYILKVNDNSYSYLVLAILNSRLVNYLLSVNYRKRVFGSYPKVNSNDIINIPIPKNLNTKTVSDINVISKNISNGRFTDSAQIEQLNEAIYDLYNLDFLERNRIDDFFIKDNERVTETGIKNYCRFFNKSLKHFLKDGYNLVFEYNIDKNIDFAGIKVSFVSGHSFSNNPSIKKTIKFISYDLISQIGNKNILALKERIYGKNDIYIIKDTKAKSWTKTKAFEDSQTEITKLKKK